MTPSPSACRGAAISSSPAAAARAGAIRPAIPSGGAGNNPTYARVRNLINAGDLAGAERLLYEVPQKSGEWYFLSGSIAYRKGWLDEAAQNFTLAVQMEPGNHGVSPGPGYAPAAQRRLSAYGTGTTVDGLDCCTTMLCLNCLCGGGSC